MKNNITTYLNRVYPYYYNLRNTIIIGGLVLLLSVCFSIFFEPFEVNQGELKFSFFLVSLIHSLLSLVVFFILVLVLQLFRTNGKTWRIKDEFGFLLTLIIIIGVFQFLIRDFIYDKDDNWSLRYLYEEVRNTILVGGLLIFIITSINAKRLNLKKESKEKEGMFSKDSIPFVSNEIAIKTQVRLDDFVLNINEFVCAKSDKNYVKIVLNNDVMLKRMTIKSLEDQLCSYKFIFRTHRSFILNLKVVQSVERSSQGYKVLIRNFKEIVPVSRAMIIEFDKKNRTINN